MTHYVDSSSNSSSSTSTSTTTLTAREERTAAVDQPFRRPWPDEHDTFCREHGSSVSLEIASGSSQFHPARMIEKEGMAILLPGSLRERGEFCLLDLKLDRTSSKSRRFTWCVKSVNIHRMGDSNRMQ